MSEHPAAIVSITVQKLDDCFYAASSDVPGVHVCGDTVEQTIESAARAVKVLFKVNRNMDVDVVPASAYTDGFPGATRPIDKLVVQTSVS